MFKSMVKSINDTISEVNLKNGIVVMSILGIGYVGYVYYDDTLNYLSSKIHKKEATSPKIAPKGVILKPIDIPSAILTISKLVL